MFGATKHLFCRQFSHIFTNFNSLTVVFKVTPYNGSSLVFPKGVPGVFNVWVPLFNLPGEPCVDSGCEGKLRWMQGEMYGVPYPQVHSMSLDGSQPCVAVDGNTQEFKSLSCTSQAIVMCEFDCDSNGLIGRSSRHTQDNLHVVMLL